MTFGKMGLKVGRVGELLTVGRVGGHQTNLYQNSPEQGVPEQT